MMFNNNNYRKINHLKKFQQGGGMYILNPNRFSTDLPSVNPALFSNVNISPGVDPQQLALDDYRREQAALQREKMKQNMDMLDRKQAFEIEKKIFDSYLKDIYSSTPSKSASNKLLAPIFGDLKNSPRFRDQYNLAKGKELETLEELLKINSSPINDQKSSQMLKTLEKLRQAKEQTAISAPLDIDATLWNKVTSIVSDPKSKVGVNKIVFNQWLDNYIKYYNNEPNSELTYKPGVEPPGLFYDKSDAQKKFDNLVTTLNSRVLESKQVVQENGVYKEKSKYGILDPELAANSASESVSTDPELSSYFQDRFNIKLDSSPDDKKVIAETLLPLFKADDALKNLEASTTEVFKSKVTAPSGGGSSRSTGGTQKTLAKNQDLINNYRKKHYDSSTKTINRQSVASDPETPLVASSIVDNLYPSLGQSNAADITKRTALMESAVSEFLIAGGDPSNVGQMSFLKTQLDKILSVDLGSTGTINKINKTIRENVIVNNQTTVIQSSTQGFNQKKEVKGGKSGTCWTCKNK